MGKRQFIIDIGSEKLEVEGHIPRNVAVKYLMKRRRSVLMTKDPEKVEKLFSALPQTIKILGKKGSWHYKINWERVGKENFEGARFIFTIDDEK